MVAQLGEPQLIDLGEGPAIERGPPLIAMLLGQHALQRAANSAVPSLRPPTRRSAKRFSRGSMAIRPGRIENRGILLPALKSSPAAWVVLAAPGTSLANQEDSIFGGIPGPRRRVNRDKKRLRPGASCPILAQTRG